MRGKKILAHLSLPSISLIIPYNNNLPYIHLFLYCVRCSLLVSYIYFAFCLYMIFHFFPTFHQIASNCEFNFVQLPKIILCYFYYNVQENFSTAITNASTYLSSSSSSLSLSLPSSSYKSFFSRFSLSRHEASREAAIESPCVVKHRGTVASRKHPSVPKTNVSLREQETHDVVTLGERRRVANVIARRTSLAL